MIYALPKCRPYSYYNNVNNKNKWGINQWRVFLLCSARTGSRSPTSRTLSATGSLMSMLTSTSLKLRNPLKSNHSNIECTKIINSCAECFTITSTRIQFIMCTPTRCIFSLKRDRQIDGCTKK